MSLPRHMTQEEMTAAISELDQAIHAHEQWIEDTIANLICHLKPDERDTCDDSWRKCRFGQWYYRGRGSKLSDCNGFREVETEHKRMHQYAASLLAASEIGTPISLQDYERFTSAQKRMRLEILSLKREIEVALYNIDALTGVPGRLQMLQKLRENHEFVVRKVHPCSVAMLDIDKFKSINDVHGHPVGDHVLKDVAGYVQAHLRTYDILFRYGGEEFLLCMPDTNLESAREICDRIRSELGGLVHEPGSNGGFRVTVSIGVAEMDAENSVEETIDRADQALLAAKDAGRDRVLAWDSSFATETLAA